MSTYSKEWLAFLGKIEDARHELDFNADEECFFRGHTQSSHRLLPGLHRLIAKQTKKMPGELWSKESDLFYEFRAKARDLHNQVLGDWDILFFMQHHGVKTRLLDWTESLAVAIYFSLLEYDPQKNSPSIWMMNPYKLNEEYHDARDLYDPRLLNYYDDPDEEGESYADLILYGSPDVFPWNEPVGLYPVRRVDRLTSQSGYFTIHGNDSRPIDEIVPASKNIWRKIELPGEAVDSAFAFLEHAGINQFTLFPDMDGLSKYLNQKYFKANTAVFTKPKTEK